MEIKTINEIVKGNVLGIEFHTNDKDKKWIALDDVISLFNHIKSPFPDFICECSDGGICAMCAVKEIVEKGIKELNTQT